MSNPIAPDGLAAFGQSLFDLTGKAAVVTGAGRGLGRAIAFGLAAQGAKIFLSGRTQATLEETATELEELGAEVGLQTANVADEEEVIALKDAAIDRFGAVDILVNNAGVNPYYLPADRTSLSQWQELIDVNLTGVFLCMQQAFRIMKDQDPRGGRIINNGSISADRPRPNSSPYTATKHAVSGLTKAGSLDGRKYDIAVGQIDIGNADTEMMAKAKTGGMPQANGQTSIEPMMDVKAVADAVVFMASLPLDANVQFMTVMATKMPLIGRG